MVHHRVFQDRSPIAWIDYNKIFLWEKGHEKAFETLKEKVWCSPMLSLPNIRLPFKTEVDTYGYLIGAMLLQQGIPMAYHLETFMGAVINYPTYDKELYAIALANKHWSHYLPCNTLVLIPRSRLCMYKMNG
jgi:hypothetical protein